MIVGAVRRESMARLLIAVFVALGMAACGPADETWNAPLDGDSMHLPAIDGAVAAPSPAQQFLLLLTGGGVSTECLPFHGAGSAGESSPDPMPGRQRDDDPGYGPRSARLH
jgi:hypothetical protein